MNSALSPDTPTDVRAQVISAILSVAPDVAGEIETIGDHIDVFEEFGFDSMDRTNILIALENATGRDVPDDYSHLNSIDQLIGHFS